MKESSKNRLFGICGTVIFHVTLILILFLVTFSQPSIPDDGEGILVQVGLVSESQGTLDSSSDIQSQEKNSPEETIDDNEIISQETEETIQITPPEEKKKDSEKKEIKKEEKMDSDTNFVSKRKVVQSIVTIGIIFCVGSVWWNRKKK